MTHDPNSGLVGTGLSARSTSVNEVLLAGVR